MSKYRKPFISELKRHWAQRFPLWRPGVCTPVFWERQDATFTDDSALGSSGMAFHAVVDFTPKWPGAFTCDIVITPGLEALGDPPRRWPDDVASLPIGSYRIGWFIAGRDIWWRLVDDAAESRKIYEEILGVNVAAFGIERQPDHWYATSYGGGLGQVISEAVQHFSDTFERHVIPKLHRKT